MTGFTRKDKMIGALLAVVMVLFFASLFLLPANTQPVMAAVITPVAQTGRDGSRIAEFMDTRVITEDTRVCFDMSEFEVMDLQYDLDATAANATTVTMQQTNIDPTSGPFNAGTQVLAVTTPTDADGMTQYPLFGRWNCVYADVTNSNPLTLTIIGVAK